MTEQPITVENKGGKCLLHNWVEESATAALDTAEMKTQIQRHGHKGIITIDQESRMETITTLKAAYAASKSPGVRLRGMRGELLEKHIAQTISQQIQSELNQPPPKTDYSSTTQRDFCVKGFMPLTPKTTQVHDYKTDQAITFWSENYQQIQGATAAPTLNAPFRKSAMFSTPISERLDETELPSDN